MANPRTNFWDDTDESPHYLDDEDVPHYPKLTARRVAIAHALGVAGVIGTVALAAAAFAPRVSGGVHSLTSLFTQEKPVVSGPHGATQVQPPQPVAAPVETSVPKAPAPVEPPPVVEPPAALAAAPSNPATAAASDSANSPSTPSQTPAGTTPTIPSEPAASPVAVAATPSQALAEPASSGASNDAGAATPTTPAATSPSAAVKSSAAPRSTAGPQVRHSRPEPRLTWGEIQRRRERYAEWLKQQHLEPVH